MSQFRLCILICVEFPDSLSGSPTIKRGPESLFASFTSSSFIATSSLFARLQKTESTLMRTSVVLIAFVLFAAFCGLGAGDREIMECGKNKKISPADFSCGNFKLSEVEIEQCSKTNPDFFFVACKLYCSIVHGSWCCDNIGMVESKDEQDKYIDQGQGIFTCGWKDCGDELYNNTNLRAMLEMNGEKVAMCQGNIYTVTGKQHVLCPVIFHRNQREQTFVWERVRTWSGYPVIDDDVAIHHCLRSGPRFISGYCPGEECDSGPDVEKQAAAIAGVCIWKAFNEYPKRWTPREPEGIPTWFWVFAVSVVCGLIGLGYLFYNEHYWGGLVETARQRGRSRVILEPHGGKFPGYNQPKSFEIINTKKNRVAYKFVAPDWITVTPSSGFLNGRSRATAQAVFTSRPRTKQTLRILYQNYKRGANEALSYFHADPYQADSGSSEEPF